MTIPDPAQVHPLPHTDRVVFLKPIITSEKIEVGDYSYYDRLRDQQRAQPFRPRSSDPLRRRLLSATIAAIRTCGSPLCRGVVTGEDWRRPELQARYGDHWIPALLRKQRAG